jgi:hypothetical protein
MERFDFSRLNSQSFERLVRALAFHHFGPSGRVFSAGPDPTVPTDPSIATLVPEIIARAKAEGIFARLPRRYPAYVSLPRFADAISRARNATQPLPSLLSYLASTLSRECDDTIDRTDIRLWLKTYPWIIVMDGLDEVPPSGERRAILDSISRLLTEISDASADVLLVVTTRPQGYNKDFSDEHWEHWRLAELPPERSLAYAKALSIARYPKDSDRRESIDALIEKAARQQSTLRLMTSPLQVTIMHMIVDTGGGVGGTRS